MIRVSILGWYRMGRKPLLLLSIRTNTAIYRPFGRVTETTMPTDPHSLPMTFLVRTTNGFASQTTEIEVPREVEALILALTRWLRRQEPGELTGDADD